MALNAGGLVDSWLARGRARVEGGGITLAPRAAGGGGRAEKLRAAYRWIAENAIWTACVDVEIGSPTRIGRGERPIEVYDGQSYASFILLPILNLIAARRMVFVGGTGRGKTTMATLMALVAGEELEEVRHTIQHGHPQLTIADLLGSPLPSELVRAERASEVKVSWRKWIGKRVKIIDEYNRIPTKTQSALLSLMSEGYAEMFEQIVTTGRSAWYLTANDDLGGGTFPVIEALQDRIDLVVRSTPFHSGYLESLAQRVSSARSAEEFVPQEIVVGPEALDAIDAEVRATPVAAEVLETIAFLLGQLDFCRRASDRLEYMSKDTLRLAGRRVGHVCNEDCPLDKTVHLCTQTERGVSARAYQALIHYSKALAWFRGAREVGAAEVRALLPWVLHQRLEPNLQSPFFEREENKVFLTDRVSWIRQLYDRALEQHAAYRGTRAAVAEVEREGKDSLASLSTPEVQRRISRIERLLADVSSEQELNGPVQQDLLLLKSLHARYAGRLAVGPR